MQVGLKSATLIKNQIQNKIKEGVVKFTTPSYPRRKEWANHAGKTILH